MHSGGDYKSPPTEDYTDRHRIAKRLLKREPVILTPAARAAAVASIRKTFLEVHRLELLAVSVSAMHLHLLARFPPPQKPTPPRGGLSEQPLPFRERDPVRFHVGVAKERSAKQLASERLTPPGKVWAKRGKIVRVRDRRHQVNVMNYILDHAREGAAVWSFRDKPSREIFIPNITWIPPPPGWASNNQQRFPQPTSRVLLKPIFLDTHRSRPLDYFPHGFLGHFFSITYRHSARTRE